MKNVKGKSRICVIHFAFLLSVFSVPAGFFPVLPAPPRLPRQLGLLARRQIWYRPAAVLR
jgi:hypothetical protein